MLSHQPEVSRLLHQEHTERLTRDAQDPMPSVSLPSPPPVGALAGLAAIRRVALSVFHRRLAAGHERA